MDGELKNLKCNICQLAAITGLHRQTVVSRLSGVPLEKQNIMNKKHTNHHLLKINDIKTESYNMMMMHEKSKMRQIPR
ncbi:DUF1441 family protein, partial [Salmonella enterica subsp. enterica serovar Virginia]|nr:DUF1441 family protein [Salmonella enterica subsp. enterica serovar Virginia]